MQTTCLHDPTGMRQKEIKQQEVIDECKQEGHRQERCVV